ncbi:hypothetical protein P4N68_00715 [Corynebacterium felinum]|uniref:Secreted protein n=1 Tax=Corynebacterium felinum TaxID=131318 RepID=A0ABU2B6M9_9CORY|nr:hypothetical protein [Corynebacterium felinum]MDF5819601.1 hypothetical protein [Corynebacterium felinum]MDR7354271.1 hypothetical protein [Corynebacterium felinum]WJY96439.1 hypothetical protein CFELI_14340 [Corynebacterium felinum]
MSTHRSLSTTPSHQVHYTRATAKEAACARWRRRGISVCVAVALGMLGSVQPVVVFADALPNSPSDPAAIARWVNPDVRSADGASELSISVTGTPARIDLGQQLLVNIRIANNSRQAHSGLLVVPQHADAPESLARARALLADAPSAYPYFARTQEISGQLRPGEVREMKLVIDTAPDVSGGLNIATAGIYPILIALQDPTTGAKLDTQRFLLSVGAVPTPPSSAPLPQDAANTVADNPELATPTADFTQPASSPVKTSVLYPISATVDIVGGETGESRDLIVRTEDLSTQLGQGGRLDELIDDYSAAVAASDKLAQSMCLALDPQLIDAVDRMTQGYKVAATRPSSVAQNRRLRDSWTMGADEFEHTPGQGVQAAKNWLERVKKLSQESSCVIALPWANTDLNAVSATGNDWLMREALQRGNDTLNRVLDIAPRTNIVIPGSGYISEATAVDLGWADQAHLLGEKTPHSPADAVAGTHGTHTGDTAAPDTTHGGNEHSAAQETPPANTDVAVGTTMEGLTDPSRLAHSIDQAWDNDRDNAGHHHPAPVPSTPVTVMVADNTVWEAPTVDRFSHLAPGVRAVSYSGSLAAILAEASNHPVTIGFSNYSNRFDYRSDSQAARRATADSAIRMTIAEHQRRGDTQPMLIPFPAAMTDSTIWLKTLIELFDHNITTPVDLREYLNPSSSQEAELNQLVAAAPVAENTRFGAPFDDPTTISDTEILRARRQAESIDNVTQLLLSDPVITLTPYGFTEPLRKDILRAFTHNQRQSMGTFDSHVSWANDLLNANRDILTELRNSVSLRPPGNVYTRISDASPLLIVAQNGLPLPVDARIRYSGPEGSEIHVPDTLFIPAKGSITVQMTADLVDDSEGRTDLNLWLAANNDAAISDPVTIGVRTRSGILGASGLAAAVLIGLAVTLVGRVIVRKKHRA